LFSPSRITGRQDAWALTSLAGHSAYARGQQKGAEVTMLCSTTEPLRMTENLCKSVKAAVWLL